MKPDLARRFRRDDGEEVSINIADSHAKDGSETIQQAKELMAQLTPLGTHGSGAAANVYDAASNGNFDEVEFASRH
ncbi:hypothetical protein SB748_27505 [Rhizobium sp. SIMBA_035]